LESVPSTFRTYLDWGCLILQLAPLLNIIAACMPLFRKEDDLSDIPLTAEQRRLLGLPPSSAAPTPDAKYSTPPRYSRTPSIAGSIGSNRSYTSSPLSGKGSPLVQGSGGGLGSYSPLGSPLFKRGLDASTNGRRSSISNGSPFATSSSPNLFAEPPASPSPAGGKRTSVGLNSKWLYERGRRSSGSAFLH
jgi:nucleoporin POM34